MFTTTSRSLLLATLLLALHGCTLLPEGRDAPAPVETRDGRPPAPDAPQPAPPAERAPAEPNAVQAYGPLLARAETATRAGDYDQALGLLERAQRIDPDSAEVYLHLARTYASQGRQDRARATAERGLLYCRSQRECDALREFLR